MQIKIISVPAIGGEAMNDELNAFLRSKKVIEVRQDLVTGTGGSAYWTFVIHYTEDYSPFPKAKDKVDYKEVLSEVEFQRFSALRVIRKQVASEEGLPAFAVFTDEELAEMSKIEVLTAADMKKIKGIGDKKTERFGQFFISKNASNEKSQSPDALHP
jgi:superfamily II DNA helicase RecQ